MSASSTGELTSVTPSSMSEPSWAPRTSANSLVTSDMPLSSNACLPVSSLAVSGKSSLTLFSGSVSETRFSFRERAYSFGKVLMRSQYFLSSLLRNLD